jgi:hypothetical protein
MTEYQIYHDFSIPLCPANAISLSRIKIKNLATWFSPLWPSAENVFS